MLFLFGNARPRPCAMERPAYIITVQGRIVEV